MIYKEHKRNRGITFVEVMVSMVILAIAVLGSMGFRYYSAVDARKADVQNGAARVCSMFLESWKGLGGLSEFDPEVEFGSEWTISGSVLGQEAPEGFEKLGDYLIEFDGAHYYATLCYKGATETEPRALNVCTVWRHNYEEGEVSSSDKSVKLTTYVGN